MPTKGETREVAVRELYREHGRVTPELLLSAASNPAHPCHSEFDWNDATCAHNARLTRAYEIIKSIKFFAEVQQAREAPVRVVPIQSGVRAFVPAFDEPRLFRPRSQVLSVAESRWQFIQAKLRELSGWVNSVQDIEELAPLREFILRESEQVTSKPPPVLDQTA